MKEKVVRVHYSSPRNITFYGVDDVYTMSVEEAEALVDSEGELCSEFFEEEALNWMWENVDVFVEIVDKD